MTTRYTSPEALRRLIWEQRYRAAELGETVPEDSLDRVAGTLAVAESTDRPVWRRRFAELLQSQRFLPGGRILAAAGRDRDGTLANCFVMGSLEDNLDGILTALRESALTLQAGGGIGLDFSPLRPRGRPAVRTDRTASGPVSFLQLWNQLSDTLLQDNPRQGAMMGVLDCAHPDLLAFIDAKTDPTALTHFNLSVRVSDAFMEAVEADARWTLRFAGRPFGMHSARELWDALTEAASHGGEPGLLFGDTVNRNNRLHYCETLAATNPCGELPLPTYGACVLGSINLTRFAVDAFTARATFDWPGLEASTALAVRMLDNALSLAHFPLPMQRDTALRTRRIGLGVTGLADLLILLDLRYDSTQGRDLAARVLERIRDTAYRTSCRLAEEKGAFPELDAKAYLATPSHAPLPPDVAASIRQHGIRNSHLTAIAPAGSISLLAGNVSSGIEPVVDRIYTRRIGTRRGSREILVADYAWQQWQQRNPGLPPPESFLAAGAIEPTAQLEMLAVLQPWVDSGISKTLNLPRGTPPGSFGELYRRAWRMGLKGITGYPADAGRGAVIHAGPACIEDTC